jgi:hypothetical protein
MRSLRSEWTSGSGGFAAHVPVTSPWVAGTMSSFSTIKGALVTISSGCRATSPSVIGSVRDAGTTEAAHAGVASAGGRVTRTATQPSGGGRRRVTSGSGARPWGRGLGPVKCRQSEVRQPRCLVVGDEGGGVAVDEEGLVAVGAAKKVGGAALEGAVVAGVVGGVDNVGALAGSGIVLPVPVPFVLGGCTRFAAVCPSTLRSI